MAGEIEDDGGQPQDWEGIDDYQSMSQDQELMRKLKKITFIQRGEGIEAGVEQVRLELDKELSREKAAVDMDETNADEQINGEDQGTNECAAEGTEAGWESFLPRRHLRVLLVEDDDSTRHVVGALLRNCNYDGELQTGNSANVMIPSTSYSVLYTSFSWFRVFLKLTSVLTVLFMVASAVTPASNGHQAWDLLQDSRHQVDIVLTDVVMPGITGLSLLSKIMTTESCKSVPVISEKYIFASL